MFTFTLAFFAGQEERRNLEERIQKENHWPQLQHVSGIECQIDHFVCFEA